MKFLLKLLCVISLLALCIPCQSQHTEEISLEAAAQRFESNPTTHNLYEYAYLIWFEDVDLAIIKMKEVVQLATAENNLKITAAAHQDLARFYNDKALTDSSEYHFAEAISISEYCDFNNILGYALNTRAYLRFNYTNNIPGAIEDVNRALTAFDKSRDYLGASFCYQNLGDFFVTFNQYDKAAEMYSNIFEVRKLSTESIPIYNQAEAIWNYSNALIQLEQYPEAIKNLSVGIEMLKDRQSELNGSIWSRLHLVRAEAYMDSGLLDEAATDITKAEKYVEGLTLLFINSLHKYLKGKLHFLSGEYAQASSFLKEIINTPDDQIASPIIKISAIEMMEIIYNKEGATTQAYAMSKMLVALKDKLYNPQHLGAILNELRTYEIDAKENERVLLQSESLTSQLSNINLKNQFIILGLIVTLLLAAFGLFEYRKRALLKREKLRTKISRDLHDEVGGLLAGIALQSDIATMKDDNASEEIKGIATLSRSAINKMGDVLWSIDARRDTWSDLIQRMKEHAAESFANTSITFDLNSSDIKMSKTISPTKRQHLYLIFKEAINNILKHSNATHVDVSISNHSKFQMTIKDNGNSIKQNIKSGQGIQNLHERASELKGEIRISSEEGYTVALKCQKI